MGKTAMHPLNNGTRFFAVVGAPYIPESHLDDCCDQAHRQSFAAAELNRESPPADADKATAWWPHTRH
jgi:hypothetical protein